MTVNVFVQVIDVMDDGLSAGRHVLKGIQVQFKCDEGNVQIRTFISNFLVAYASKYRIKKNE